MNIKDSKFPFDREIQIADAKPWVWPNFKPSEFASNGNGMVLINNKSIDSLQLFRNLVGVPVIINSAYRDHAYNKSISGASSSMHLFGRAFDIRITKSLTREMIHKFAKQAGFTGFGDYNTFVHIDTGRPRYWDFRT